MMPAKAFEKTGADVQSLRPAGSQGFALISVVVVIFASVVFLSSVLAYAVLSYRLERARLEKEQLEFAAKSGVAVSLERLLAGQKKAFTDLADLEQACVSFPFEGFQVETRVEDENAKLSLKAVSRLEAGAPGPDFARKLALLSERGLRNKETSDIAPFVTRFGDGALNLNTAPQEILELFFSSSGTLREFLAQRSRRPLENMSEAQFVRQDLFLREALSDNLSFTVKSRCFTIMAVARSKKRSSAVTAVYSLSEKGARLLFCDRD
jgi:type II secretory pathway component PulK